MVNKNQKLQEQFQEQSAAVQATAGQQTSDLFRGISIHVNGLTTPSLAVRQNGRQCSEPAQHSCFVVLLGLALLPTSVQEWHGGTGNAVMFIQQLRQSVPVK